MMLQRDADMKKRILEAKQKYDKQTLFFWRRDLQKFLSFSSQMLAI